MEKVAKTVKSKMTVMESCMQLMLHQYKRSKCKTSSSRWEN